ncbi:hypothetical protein CCR90_16900 [Rhodovulum sulfidophilum]|uniref:DUF6950 family protein n=1 Tax=Rhodovulum sulfidophilum TaxID=35806 RepID=UPI000695DC7D|nr:hypothetical protein [Rhodovulum sulfidophilum]ANB34646.1 hypothetical protein A6W98_11585 [Rhodovulum sulfidophilum DSM 1374]ANB38468.1 hypothetical protein A6024_11450 [Rhodovulum sulfidophilum]MBK5925416.1 hypothetical protein [Rhodovulum sulfidophilum]MBL3587572.1 hypothetical protein [Rhodovulum sulfidophilum]MCE8458510.1 hypothetical protein [Rhodovulum sulfidophilum]
MRRAGWERRLSAAVRDWEDRPFAWGTADCLGFCRAVARSMTWEDPIPGLPDYGSEYGAAKVLVSLGFGSIEALVDAHLARLPVAGARRGDWVMTACEGAMPGAMGVVTGRYAQHMGRNGLVRRPVLTAEAAWRID